MAMLEINDLHVNYGMIAALKGISFEVNEGEVISLIGANGAGKTTTLHTLTGLISAKSGSIKFNGVELTKTPAHKIVEMGIAHVPEGRRIFQNLTVLDNLKHLQEKTRRIYRRIFRIYTSVSLDLQKEKIR